MIELADKVAVVTGGAGGIGRAIAADLARLGAAVVVWDVDGAAAGTTAVSLQQQTGSRVMAVAADVTDLGAVQTAVEQIIATHQRIDILINNAGWDRFALFLDTTPDFWDKIIAINYKGVLNVCYAVLPHMIQRRGGSIVNIASDAGRSGSLGESVYAGCKAAVIAFSKTIAREHARDNIRVNVVAPGVTNTPIFNAFHETPMGSKVAEAIVKSVPLGRRAAEPSEISPAVLFLASDAAGYITGQVLSVSGGLTMVD